MGRTESDAIMRRLEHANSSLSSQVGYPAEDDNSDDRYFLICPARYFRIASP